MERWECASKSRYIVWTSHFKDACPDYLRFTGTRLLVLPTLTAELLVCLIQLDSAVRRLLFEASWAFIVRVTNVSSIKRWERANQSEHRLETSPLSDASTRCSLIGWARFRFPILPYSQQNRIFLNYCLPKLWMRLSLKLHSRSIRNALRILLLRVI